MRAHMHDDTEKGISCCSRVSRIVTADHKREGSGNEIVTTTKDLGTDVASNRPTEALASVISFTFVTINTLNT